MTSDEDVRAEIRRASSELVEDDGRLLAMYEVERAAGLEPEEAFVRALRKLIAAYNREALSLELAATRPRGCA